MELQTSPLVEMAAEAGRPTRWWLAWIVGAVVITVGTVLGDLIGSAVLGAPRPTDTRYQFTELFLFGTTLLLLFLWVRLKEKRRFSSIGFRGANPVGKVLLGLVIGAAMMTLGVLIPWSLGEYAIDVSPHTTLGASALVPVALLLPVFLVQASTEEAVLRGYMLQVAGRQINGVVAIVAGSVLFAVLHLDFEPIVLANITLYAVFASFLALGQGNLWLVAGIHTGWNYFQGNVFGLPVSGNAEASSLFAFGPAPDSQALLTGGDFGVEASLVGTAILAIATVIAVTYYRRQERRRRALRSPAVHQPSERA
ncbi:CPBP family intramembrane metalloprotease [Rathayibacter oskolensis]|uniref:CPBP family intramembrane glutamic endopeptidase n=1 Tax=Rathayibacter oskolensis TaxID=1891671 RepID=UPI00265F7CBC|nr:CPBP family intramembrane glutamic endopeptidase [Rathayibacter oskolensis]WKK70487.1 CPBP family intramembrane metalloprotease [Rathayibacter oskolensis]